MIINTELVDGIESKILKISYIAKDGTAQMINCPVPESMMYNWLYAKENSPQKHPVYQSWDFKPVRQEPTNKLLSQQRIQEIIVDCTRAYPEVMQPIYELYTPQTAFCDIEVDVQDDGFPDAKEARNPINTMSWVKDELATVIGRANLSEEDIRWIENSVEEYCAKAKFKTKYKFKYVYYQREFDMVHDIVYEYLGKSHCTTGWNFLDYDYRYIYNRAKFYGINLSDISPTGSETRYTPVGGDKEDTVMLPTHKLLYDYKEIFGKWDRTVDPKENLKLDWVSEQVLGTKKVEHNLGFKEFWEQMPREYVFYNAIDSILVKEMDEKIRTSSAFMGLANLTHVPALIAFSPVKSLEIVQAEYLYKEGRVVPKDRKAANPNNDGYEGAFVYDPIPAVYKNVFACDFRSLYPSIEMQFNISPDTYITKDKNRPHDPNEVRTTSGAVYRKDIDGFIPTITSDFFNKRREYKKEMQIAEHECHELERIYEERFKKTA